jgi:hypothetical protein
MLDITRAGLALTLAGLAAAGHAQATLDLLTNGDGEVLGASRGNSRGQPMHALTGWSADDDQGWVAQTSGWGGLRAPRGQVFLRANTTAPGALWQDVDLTALGGKPRSLLLSGWLAGGRDRDRLELGLELLDADGEVLRAHGTGEVGGAAWSRCWLVVGLDDGLAARCKKARVKLSAQHREGQYLDAQADGVSLWALGPGLPADRRGDKELTAALESPDAAARLPAAAALLATTAGKARAEKWLGEQLTAAKDPAQRQDLLALAVLGGHRDASKLLRTTLEGGDDETRALAFELLPLVSGVDWRRVASQLAAGQTTGRAAALRALVRDDHKDAQRALVALHEQADAEGKLGLLRALAGREKPLDDVYRGVLLPHLTKTAPAELRHAAMAALGAWRDPRLIAHLSELLPAEEQRGRRGAWLEWCARLDTVPAVEAIAQLAGKGEARADAALLQHLPRLQSSAVVTWARTTGLTHALAAVQIAAAELLAQRGSEADVATLSALGRDADVEVATAAAAAAIQLARGEARTKLLAALPKLAPAAAARALRVAWRGTPDAALQEATRSLAAADATPLRVAAIDCLGPKAGELLQRAMRDPAWQVRAVAHRALSQVRERASIELLLAQLPHESGPSLRSACAALDVLTGARKGADPAAWLAWWKLAGAEFRLPESPTKPSAATERAATPDAGTTVARYHGAPVYGDRIVFVVDLSGSMREPLPGRDGTRLQVAQRELIAVLGALGPQRAFDIVVFGDDATAFAGTLQPATPANVEAATKWVEKLETRGWTNLWSGLARALATPDVDAIYVLSDGAPSVGRYVAAGAIRAQVRLRNADVLATVHTIALGGDRRDRQFLEALARDHGGTCTDAK